MVGEFSLWKYLNAKTIGVILPLEDFWSRGTVSMGLRMGLLGYVNLFETFWCIFSKVKPITYIISWLEILYFDIEAS